MKILVGLGNPGKQYSGNRHNVGFMFLDYIVEQVENGKLGEMLGGYRMRSPEVKNERGSKFKIDKKLRAEIAEITIPKTSEVFEDLTLEVKHKSKIILVKPRTFMNESGRVVRKVMSNVKCQMSNLFVVHDDLDIRLGEFKIQLGRGPHLHNGIASIERELGATDFWRVRVGVDNREPDNRIAGRAYVLQDFTPEERVLLVAAFYKILQQLLG